MFQADALFPPTTCSNQRLAGNSGTPGVPIVGKSNPTYYKYQMNVIILHNECQVAVSKL